jgi:TP901 family phage tail tape measure protein
MGISDVVAVLRLEAGQFKAELGKASAELDGLGKSSASNFEKMGSVSRAAGAAVAIGVGAAVVACVDLAEKFQSTTASIAANGDISSAAAKGIGDAFLNTAGTTTFSGQQMGTAFAGVAGQVKLLNGGFLDSKTALDVMRPSMDLAEASGTDLSLATGDVTKSLQAFGLGVSSSPLVANVLFNAAKDTGVSVDTLNTSLDKARAQMGAGAPPIQALGGFLVDLANHGETGRAAMSALSTTMNSLLKPTAKDTADQVALLGHSFIDAKGNLEPMGQIISDVSPKIAGMGNAQATATLNSLGFGAASSKLVGTIQAGAGAYDAATASVSKVGSAHDAAAKKAATLHGEMATLKAELSDDATKIGEGILPALTTIAKDALGVVTAVAQLPTPVLEGIAAFAGAVGVAVAIDKIATSISGVVKDIANFASAAAAYVARTLGMGAASVTATGEMDMAGVSVQGLGTKSLAAGGEMDLAAISARGVGTASGAAGMAGGIGSAGTAIGGVMATLGPLAIGIGAIALGAYALTKAIGTTKDSLQALADKQADYIKTMPTTSVLDLQLKMDRLKQAQDTATEAMKKGGLEGKAAGLDYKELQGQINTLQTQTKDYNDSVNTLSSTFGLSKTATEQLATAAGVTLTAALTPTDVQAFSQALEASGTASDKTKGQLATLATNGQANFAAIAAAAQTGSTQIITAMSAAATNSATAFSGIGWFDIGAHMAAGVTAGINAGAGGMVTAAQSAANAANAAMRTMSLSNLNAVVQGYAAGGNVTAGVPAIVGEKGPEIFVPSVSGSIIPNSALNAAMGTSAALLAPHGNAIMQGLAVGLQQGLNSKVVPLVAGVSGQMVAIMKTTAGISSPSTVFATQVGLPIAQGIAAGITNGTAPVMGASTALIAAATTAVGAALAASDPQLVGSVADLLDQVTNAVANGQPEIIAGIQAVAHGMTTAWTTAVSTAGPAFDQSIADLLGQVKNAVANGQPGIVAAITAAATGIAAAATAAVLPAYNATTSGQLGIIGNGFGTGATAPLSLPAFASGGNVTAGVPAIVGEKGPEIFVPSVNGSIIPNNALNTAGAGGGPSVTYSPTYYISGTPESMLRQMQEMIDQGTQKLDQLIKARGR